MDEQLGDAFEVCLAAMRSGVKLDNCLALYPDMMLEIRTALEGARYAQLLEPSDVPPLPFKSSRARFWKQLAELEGRRRSFFPALRFPRLAFVTLIVILVCALSWNSLLVASAKSLPGDRLYPVKRAAEKIAMGMPPIVASHQEIKSVYYHRRAEEVEDLFRLGRSERISLEGVLSEISANRLVVEGIPVVADANTLIIGRLSPGVVVEVEGLTLPAGFIQAAEIHLRYYALFGNVNEIGQMMWIIAGNKVRLLPGAQIDPSLHVGDQALALVYATDAGTLTTQAVIRFSKDAIESQLQTDPSILPRAFSLEGTVVSMDGEDWVIGTQAVNIAAKTEIKGEISVGSQVLVNAWQFADGTVVAAEIIESQPLVKEKRPLEIKSPSSGEDDHASEAILQKNDSGKEDDGQKVKTAETNGESGISESDDGTNKSDTSETIRNSSDNKQDDSINTSQEQDHEEHDSAGEGESGD